MGWLETLLLGLIQGLTEFLPVSSSGHLVLAGAWLGVTTPGILFEVAVHGGTLLAVLVFYRRRLVELAGGSVSGRPEALVYVGKLVLATLPAVLAALAARRFFEAQFEDPRVAALGLLATGMFLWTTRRTLAEAKRPEPTWAGAWWIGCAQALAILPGISRSGTTVATALALGVAPIAAAEFSFLMSLAAVGGAIVLQMPEARAASEAARADAGIGAAVAVVSGLAALALFVRLLRTRHFHRFAYYVWVVGAVALVWALQRG